jgi:hypothetical protein
MPPPLYNTNMSYRWFGCLKCDSLFNTTSATALEQMEEHSRHCGRNAAFAISIGVWGKIRDKITNKNGEVFKKYGDMRPVSAYDRINPQWKPEIVKAEDFEFETYWVKCANCRSKKAVQSSIDEFKNYVKDHLPEHPSRSRFLVSEDLYRFQNFDSWDIQFLVSKAGSHDALKAKKLRELQLEIGPRWEIPEKGDPLESLSVFKAGIIDEEDDSGCQVYVNATKASQYYGRDLVKVPMANNPKASANYEPRVYAWLIENGEVPETHVLERCKWNQFCVKVEHLSIRPRRIPELEML